MNIALIVLDTLRKDAFDEHFDWLPGTWFEQAWSTSHWTVPAHASLFTGKYASEVGVYAGAETLDCERPVLAEQMNDAGYTTRAFSANVNISPSFGFHRGFDQFEGSWRLVALNENVFNWDDFIARTRDKGFKRFPLALWECLQSDCDTVASLKRGAFMKLRDMGYGKQTQDDGASEALEFIQKTSFGDSEFLFINLMEAHSPYVAPSEYQSVEPPEIRGLEMSFTGVTDDPNDIRQAYHDEVRYLSDMYKEIFRVLRTEFDFILTIADHGELLGEHGGWEHMYGLHPELTHVPLSLYNGEEEVTRREESVSLLDVHQTVLATAGIDADSRGRDLRKNLGDGEYLTEYHGISNLHAKSLENKGIEDYDHMRTDLNGIVHKDFYGYETFQGFEELGRRPYKQPQNRLTELMSELNRRDIKEEENFDEAVLQQLKDLGYA
ncbi:sulfatase-like hydrolase/transferase [Haladaptatus sp. NG-SE-30]